MGATLCRCACAAGPLTFANTGNCTDSASLLNAWGTGFVQQHLIAAVRNDPSVVALGLGEAWTCGSPANVQQFLGWKARSSERNGVAMIARHGFAGPEEWVQLDTSQNLTPIDTKWVLKRDVSCCGLLAGDPDVSCCGLLAGDPEVAGNPGEDGSRVESGGAIRGAVPRARTGRFPARRRT